MTANRKMMLQKAVSQLVDGTPPSKDDESSMLRSFRLRATCQNEEVLQKEKNLNTVRQGLGLYMEYPLANSMIAEAPTREKALKQSGTKQINHVRGTDGWWKSMLAIEVRAVDNYLPAWIIVLLNATIATFMGEVLGFDMSSDLLSHWDEVYSLVLKTSLAFLLVFRLNRVAISFWEARTMWGNVTHHTRNLVGGILTHCSHDPIHRDDAIRWASSFCVATMHFIRHDDEIPSAELAGILSGDQIDRMQYANHAPLYAASMVRHNLRKIFKIDRFTPSHIAHAYAVQMNNLELLVNGLVSQVSGMERIRSTPLPAVYVTHLRTFLFAYCMFLPYVWVREWGWATIPLVGFTAFALMGIEGASSECEIPFKQDRPNHLALDAYCLIALDSIMGLVVQNANVDMLEKQNSYYESEEFLEPTDVDSSEVTIGEAL